MVLCPFTVIKDESECQSMKYAYVINEKCVFMCMRVCVRKLTGVVGSWHAGVDQALWW